MEQIPGEIMACVRSLSIGNDGKRVVLYLEASMQHGENFLPVLNIEGDTGYYLFPKAARSVVGAFFGLNYAVARERVNRVNTALGIDPEEAIDIAVATRLRGGVR